MALLLSDLQVTVQDALYASVIDEFRKSSFLLDRMPFDNAVSPTGGGTTLTYSYTRVTTQPTAATRAINSEYTAQEAKKTRYNVDVRPFGGSFKIDRVLANMGGIVDEVQFQVAQKIKATQALFSDMVINGDTESDANGFNGLKKAIISDNVVTATGLDVSTSDKLTANYLALLDMIDETIAKLDGTPTAMLMNGKTLTKMRSAARRATMYQTTQDNWGRQVDNYGNIPMVDLGAKPGTTTPIVADGDIYFVRFGLDGFHGVTVANSNDMFKTWMPDFTTSGAVKTGEVEMLAAVALKSTKAAAKITGISTSAA